MYQFIRIISGIYTLISSQKIEIYRKFNMKINCNTYSL